MDFYTRADWVYVHLGRHLEGLAKDDCNQIDKSLDFPRTYGASRERHGLRQDQKAPPLHGTGV